MFTLGIETSCDETSCSVTRHGKVLSNIVSSSVKYHSPFGGIVPEIASRYHLEYIDHVYREALEAAGVKSSSIKLICVTEGPGLMGSLLVGVSYAKALGYALKIPVIGVDHIYAHILANFLNKKFQQKPSFPFIGLVVSGGHTSLFLCRDFYNNQIVGQTLDDAAGEAFDKVAKILGLGYPGGPIIEKKAGKYNGCDKIHFPRALMSKPSLDFSFSGLKTSVLYHAAKRKLSKKNITEIAYSFQEAAVDVLMVKSINACQKFNISTLLVGGGVSCNRRLAMRLKKECSEKNINVFIPKKEYCLDNAAMIGFAGAMRFQNQNRHASKPIPYASKAYK